MMRHGVAPNGPGDGWEGLAGDEGDNPNARIYGTAAQWLAAAHGVVAAAGDGVTDDTAAFQAAADAGGPFHGAASATYRLTSTPTLTDAGLDFDGHGCTILLDGDCGLIEWKATYQNITVVSGLTNNTQVDLDDETIDSESDVAVATVASASGYATTDIVRILSEDIISGTDAGDNQKRAEFLRVALVSGSTITFYSRTRQLYSTSVRLARMNTTPRFRLRNCKVIVSDDALATWSTPAVTVIGGYRPIVENVEFEGLVERAIRFVGCYEPTTANVVANRVRTSFANNAFGYVVHEVACANGRHRALSGHNVRHVWTCSAASISSPTDLIENYGQTYGAVISDSYGFNSQAGTFDTHTDGEDITFANCVAEAPFWGPNGLAVGFGLRGRRNKLIGCRTYGANGVRAFTDSTSADASRDHEVVGHEHVANPQDTQEYRAFQVLGASGAPCSMRVVAPKITIASGYPALRADYGEMIVDRPLIMAGLTTNSTEVIRAHTSGTVRVTDAVVDFTAATGTTLRLARSSADDGTVRVDGVRIIDPNTRMTSWGDFDSLDGSITIERAKVPTDIGATWTDTSDGTYWVQYQVGEQRILEATIPLTSWRKASARNTALATSVSSNDCAMSNTAGAPIVGTSTNNTSAADSCQVEVQLPEGFVPGSTLRFHWRGRVSIARQVAQTVGITVEKIGDGTTSSPSVTNGTQSVTTSYAEYSASINASALAAGDAIRLVMTLTGNDTGGSGGASAVAVSKTWLEYHG